MNLSHIPIYDHHAHGLFYEKLWRSQPLEPCFTEAYDPVILERFVRDNLYFRRSMHDLAQYYGCEPRAEAVMAARKTQNYVELSRRMFREANITHCLIDDGIWADALMSIDDSKTLLPEVKIGRVLRLEAELAKLVEAHDSASSLFQAFEKQLRTEAPNLIGFKSIVAYRTGLGIARHSSTEVEKAYSEMRRSMTKGTPPRIASKPLLDAMLWMALKVAAETSKPVQFHTGYGDPDLDLRLANPLHLRTVLEAPKLKGLKIIMLHCYPFMREAGYLASVYSGAFLDVGLTIPYASVHGMRTALHEALHLSPISKVLFSSDAQRTPEMFWIAARWGRKLLGEVLEASLHEGELDANEAEWAAERILFGNSAELYGGIKPSR
jgi:hypothetical protein